MKPPKNLDYRKISWVLEKKRDRGKSVLAQINVRWFSVALAGALDFRKI
jgi:hypothetical protein